MVIRCCNGCVPPRRTGDCHATCTDYIIEKAFHEAERIEELEKEQARYRISNQQAEHICRQVKHHGRKYVEKSHFKF